MGNSRISPELKFTIFLFIVAILIILAILKKWI